MFPQGIAGFLLRDHPCFLESHEVTYETHLFLLAAPSNSRGTAVNANVSGMVPLRPPLNVPAKTPQTTPLDFAYVMCYPVE